MTNNADTSNENDQSSPPTKDSERNSRGTAASNASDDAGLSEKQAMVEALFRHTNAFLAEHRDDPLLVVEALAAILVRYTALLGPVAQMPERLSVLERLIGQECAQIQVVAKTGNWEKRNSGD